MSGDEKLPTWWMTDESTDPADKEDRWYYGKFHTEPYTHIPKKFQKEVVEKSYAVNLQSRLEKCEGLLSRIADYGYSATKDEIYEYFAEVEK